MRPATAVTSGFAQHRARPPTRKEEGGKPTFLSCAHHSRTSTSVHNYRRSAKEDSSRFEERRNRQHSKVSDLGAHSNKGKSGQSAGDSQRALEAPRCHGELRMRAGYTQDLEKYLECHNRLFTMDRYSPYGPWPADFASWTAFKNCLYKSPKGTTAMDAKIVMDVGKQIITVGLPQCWDMHPRVGERIVISRSHPALDSITSGIVTDATMLSFTMEWKLHWGHFEKFASEKHPMDKRCPAGHFRIDVEVEAVSTTRVPQALYTLTTTRGKEEHHVNLVTPLQAMLVCNDFMAGDITDTNNADADLYRRNQGCEDTAENEDDKRAQSTRHGASDASGASDAKGSRQDRTRSDPASPSSSKRARQPDRDNDPENAWSDCWVRPCMHVEPPSMQDFSEASSKAQLNDFQHHAMTLTGGHRFAMVRGPPGTGETQLSSAVIGAWARNLFV